MTSTSSSTLRVTGMTCGGCARAVERAAASVPGVRAARVDLAAGTLTVEGDVAGGAVGAAVRDAGYTVG